ncbi:hypothetical protein [Pseudonocardia sp. 73-21]|uniref:hypothetical protein n=1 Tax=Pseudonocardia sp. 73-21 TaxID=1895809 RepID=UPI0009648507|nr:hypothetical protein [Pseudonocardia sp. 73-21]OJY44384.1 MAG: hypothetical protein BGP03_16490 [Pseudonocardia sp. 73-21]
MDFWATLGVVWRRWYVVVPMFLLGMTAAAAVYVTVPTLYESKAVVLLSTPPTGATQYANGYRPNPINPLLNSGHGLDLTGALIIQAMRTPDFAARIGVPTDGSVEFTVNNGTSNPELLQSGPFVFFTVDSRNPALIRPLVDRALSAGRDVLAQRQQAVDAPTTTFVNYSVIVAPTDPVGMRGSRIRAAGATGALGLILCLASAFVAESVYLARSRGRANASDPVPGPDDRESHTEPATSAAAPPPAVPPPPRSAAPPTLRPDEPSRTAEPVGRG